MAMDIRFRFAAGFMGLLAGAGLALAGGHGPTDAAATDSTSRIMVRMAVYDGSEAELGISPAQMDRLQKAANAPLKRLRAMSGNARVLALPTEMSQELVQAIASRIAALPGVEDAAADRIMTIQMQRPSAESISNDPFVMDQWHYYERPGGIDVPGAWRRTVGDPSVHVAVLDTGILGTHEDLAGQWSGGYDFISTASTARDGDGRDADPTDEGDWHWLTGPSSWHGSHVAGTIAAATNNGIGGAGIAYGATIQPVRVLGRLGGLSSDIIDAIRWAAGLSVPGAPDNPNPAKVQNMSLGGTGACDSFYQSAIDDAVAAGSVVVVAAGNSSADAANFSPASCKGVITVASVDRTGDIAWYSNFGSSVEISAPGGDTSTGSGENGVLSTINSGAQTAEDDAYAFYQGTSMAAPHVAGVIALMFSVDPALTPTDVVTILQLAARPFRKGSTCRADRTLCGAGILSASRSVAGAAWLAKQR
jgi:serine protease